MFKSHGTGEFKLDQFKQLGSNVIFENGVLIFHPENIVLEDNIYIGHNSILKGYYKGLMKIGSGTWIGQQCFFHSAGNISIGKNVGIGPGVKILTSAHDLSHKDLPILHSSIIFGEVIIEDNADIGTGAILLPGTIVGKGAQIGAGAVVKSHIKPYSIAVGVPATVIGTR